MDLVARRDGYVEGVGTWIGKDRSHSFVRLLAAHKANGNDVALITPTIFQKLGKSGFCTCHLQESITQWCMTMVIQTWYQLKAEELGTPSFYLRLGYDYVYLRNSWPLNFDYLFLGTPCITKGADPRVYQKCLPTLQVCYFCVYNLI